MQAVFSKSSSFGSCAGFTLASSFTLPDARISFPHYLLRGHQLLFGTYNSARLYLPDKRAAKAPEKEEGGEPEVTEVEEVDASSM
jgi:hypothetical protein